MIEYQRDLEADHGGALEVETDHVRDTVAAMAARSDNPAVFRDQVRIWIARHPDDPSMIRIEGYLAANPVADYLDPDYEPLAGVAPELFAAEVEAAVVDEAVLRGQA